MAGVGSQVYVARGDVLSGGTCGQTVVQQPHGSDAQVSALVVPVGLGVWLLVCWCKGFDGINTRIGWPWEYCLGLWPILGFLIVCALVFYGLAGIVLASDVTTDCQLPFFAGLAAWFLAAFLLQTLPEVHGGVQFVPRFPWSYSGWFATTLCTIMWLLLAFGVAAMCFPTPEADVGPSVALVIVAVVLNALLSFAGPETTSAQDPPAACQDARQVARAEGPDAWAALLTSCKDQITKLDRMKASRMSALEKLSEDQDSLRRRIRALGIRDKEELMAHKAGQALARELVELTHDMERVAKEAEVYTTALDNAESQVRRIERRMMMDQLSVPTNDEAGRLAQIKHETEEALRRVAGARTPGSEVTDDTLLAKILAR